MQAADQAPLLGGGELLQLSQPAALAVRLFKGVAAWFQAKGPQAAMKELQAQLRQAAGCTVGQSAGTRDGSLLNDELYAQHTGRFAKVLRTAVPYGLTVVNSTDSDIQSKDYLVHVTSMYFKASKIDDWVSQVHGFVPAPTLLLVAYNDIVLELDKLGLLSPTTAAARRKAEQAVVAMADRLSIGLASNSDGQHLALSEGALQAFYDATEPNPYLLEIKVKSSLMRGMHSAMAAVGLQLADAAGKESAGEEEAEEEPAAEEEELAAEEEEQPAAEEEQPAAESAAATPQRGRRGAAATAAAAGPSTPPKRQRARKPARPERAAAGRRQAAQRRREPTPLVVKAIKKTAAAKKTAAKKTATKKTATKKIAAAKKRR